MVQKVQNESLFRYLKYLTVTVLLILWTYIFHVMSPLLTLLSPLFIGLIIAYLMNPLVSKFCERNKKSRMVNTIFVYLLFVLIFMVIGIIILPIILIEVYNLIDSVPAAIEKLKKIADATLENEFLKSRIHTFLSQKEELLNNIDVNSVSKAMSVIFKSGLSVFVVIGKVANFFLVLGSSLVIGVLIGFYFLKEIDKLWEFIRVLIPNSVEVKALNIMEKIDECLYGYLRGQLTVCVFIGIMTFVGLFLMGVKYALLIGIFAGCASVVPYLGPIMGAAPAVIQIILKFYPDMRGISFGLLKIFLLFSFIQMIDGLFISPRIVGEKSDLHPIIVMLALVIGGNFGVGGMIIAIPVAIVIKVLFYELYYKPARIEQIKFEQSLKDGETR